MTFSLALAFSCATPKTLGYLQDLQYGQEEPAAAAPELIVQTGDQLGIHVSCENPQLAAPFNLIPETADASEVHRYSVNPDGNIDFPILGKLTVAGNTLKEVQDLLAARIRELGLIRNPIVLVTLENFTVTVIGSAGNQVMPIQGNSVNLLQVLAKSAPIDEKTRIKDVMVLRTENGERKAYSVNLQSKTLFNSPVYYLKQNDVVYFKPQGIKLDTTGQMALSFATTTLTALSIITNILLWTRYR